MVPSIGFIPCRFARKLPSRTNVPLAWRHGNSRFVRSSLTLLSCQGILDGWETDMAIKLKRRLRCSFCKKPETEVAKLVGGPGVAICDCCIGGCNRILEAVPSSFAGWGS